MLSRFLRALTIALRPHFDVYRDRREATDQGRPRVLLRAQGLGLVFGGGFRAFVNGHYVATLRVPDRGELKLTYVTLLGPFTKRISLARPVQTRDPDESQVVRAPMAPDGDRRFAAIRRAVQSTQVPRVDVAVRPFRLPPRGTHGVW